MFLLLFLFFFGGGGGGGGVKGVNGSGSGKWFRGGIGGSNHIGHKGGKTQVEALGKSHRLCNQANL